MESFHPWSGTDQGSAPATMRKIQNMESQLKFDSSKSALRMDFWKHRILFSIIESIVTSPTRRPGLSREDIEYLEKMLAEVRLRKIGEKENCESQIDENGSGTGGSESFSNGNCNGSSYQRSMPKLKASRPTELSLSAKAKSAMQTYISFEIKSMAKSIVAISLENLKSSNSEDDRDKLKKITESENPLQEIVQMSIERNEEEKLLNTQIGKLIELRDKEFATYEVELAELRDLVSEIINPAFQEERHQIDIAYEDQLKFVCDNLASKNQMVKMCQLIDENPPELVSEFQETYEEFAQVVTELELEIADIKQLEERFNSLSPEFQQLIKDREDLEEDIKTKEWALKSLENFNDSSDFNTTKSSNTSFC